MHSHLRHFILSLLFLLASTVVFSADYFWVGGTGEWNDFANHWATSSGGTTPHVNAPTLDDDVYFDGNSFTAPGQVVGNNSLGLKSCRRMSWVGVQFRPTFVWQARITASILLALSPDMELDFREGDPPSLEIREEGVDSYLDLGGHPLGKTTAPAYVLLTGSVVLDRDLILPGNSTLVIFDGSLVTNGHSLNAYAVELEAYSLPGADVAGYLRPGGSSISVDVVRLKCTSNGYSQPLLAAILPEPCDFRVRRIQILGCENESRTLPGIHFVGDSAGISSYNFTLENQPFPSLTFRGPVVIDSTDFFYASVGFTCEGDFDFGKAGGELNLWTPTVFEGAVTLDSEPGNNTRIRPYHPTKIATLRKESGVVCVESADIERVKVEGEATWKAVSSSVVGPKSTGWLQLPSDDCNTELGLPEEIVMEVYPVPSNDFVTVRVPDPRPEDGMLYLVSREGRRVLLEERDFHIWEVDVSVLPPGLYLLVLVDEGKTVASRKLLVY